MLTLALRFLPETVEQGKRILVAQQLRGAGGKGMMSAVRRFRLLLSRCWCCRCAVRVKWRWPPRSGRIPPTEPHRKTCALQLPIDVMAGIVLLLAVGIVAALLECGVVPGGMR